MKPFCYRCWRLMGTLEFDCKKCDKWETIEQEYRRVARELSDANHRLLLAAVAAKSEIMKENKNV